MIVMKTSIRLVCVLLLLFFAMPDSSWAQRKRKNKALTVSKPYHKKKNKKYLYTVGFHNKWHHELEVHRVKAGWHKQKKGLFYHVGKFKKPKFGKKIFRGKLKRKVRLKPVNGKSSE